MKKIVFLFACIISFHIQAQEITAVTIPGSEVRKITSVNVPGQEYELQILVPGGFKNSAKKYPVVYIMDAQWDFPLLKSIYGQQYYDGFIPEVILCGVTWGGKNPNADSLRVRDYTPTNDGQRIQGGGADKFLPFMEKELFPFMEANYKASDERNLVGCSLGGLFALYTFFTHTQLFSGYAAASPAVGWDNEILLKKYAKEFATNSISKPVRVYMTVGDVERGRFQYEWFAKQVTTTTNKNVQIRSKVLENTGHSGTKSETYNRGLQFIYERNKLTLTPDEIKKYIGQYQLQDGRTIELKQEGTKLFFQLNAQNKAELFVNSKQHLYAVHEFFNLYFKINNGTIEGFELATYGNNQFVKKIIR